MENITYQITTLIITIIGLVLARIFVPWFQVKIGTEKLIAVEMWVKVAVAAAEQIIKVPGSGSSKKTYVVEFLKDKGVTITDQELDALIEAAVFELNKAKNLLFKNLALSDAIYSDGEPINQK